MKKYFLLFSLFTIFTVSSQVGVGTTVPTAQLDVVATNRGILIPRVDLTSLTVAAPVTNPQGGALVVSTMVYHNGTNNINAGYYYWDGTRWQGIGKSAEDRGLQYFVFSGTSGTTPATEKSTLNATLAGSGVWNSALDSAAMNTLRNGVEDNFMILFTGTLVVETAGTFRFRARTDDGGRVIVDGVPVVNFWNNQSPADRDGVSFNLAKGKHKIEFWYYENAVGQEMVFSWLSNPTGLTGVVNANSFIIE